MRQRHNKSGAVVTVVITVCMLLILGGVFYYLQIKKNESYQNELHFRELNRVAIDIDETFKQLESVSKQWVTEFGDLNAFALMRYQKTEDDNKQLQIMQLEESELQSQLGKSEQQQRQLTVRLTRLNNSLVEMEQDNKSKIEEFEVERDAIVQQRDIKRAALNTPEENLLVRIDSYMFFMLNAFATKSELKDYADASIPNTSDTPDYDLATDILGGEFDDYCSEKVEDIELELAGESFNARGICKLFIDITRLAGEQFELVESVNTDGQNYSPQELATLKTQHSKQIIASANNAVDAIKAEIGFLETQIAELEQNKTEQNQVSSEAPQQIALSKAEINQQIALMQSFETMARKFLPSDNNLLGESLQSYLNFQQDTHQQLLDYQTVNAEIEQLDLQIEEFNKKIKSSFTNEGAKRVLKDIDELKRDLANNEAKSTQINNKLKALEKKISTLEFKRATDSSKTSVFAKEEQRKGSASIKTFRPSAAKSFRQCLANQISCAQEQRQFQQSKRQLLSLSSRLAQASISFNCDLSEIRENGGECPDWYMDNKLKLELSSINGLSSTGGSSYKLVARTQYFTISLPINALLSIDKQLNRFPKLMLVSENGKVLASAEANNFTSGLKFKDLEYELAQALSNSKLNHSAPQANTAEIASSDTQITTPGTSTLIEKPLGKKEYHLFIRPYHLTAKIDSKVKQVAMSKEFYVIGLKPSKEISLARLYLTPSWMLIIMLVLVAVICTITLFKIRFVAHNYAFSRGDLTAAGIGLLIIVSLSTLIVTDFAVYREIKRQIDAEAKINFERLKYEFIKEVNKIEGFVSEFSSYKLTPKATPFTKTGYEQQAPKSIEKCNFSVSQYRVFKPCFEDNVHVEGVFEVSGAGITYGGENGNYALNEVLHNDHETDLNFRQYVKRANLQQGWNSLSTDNAATPLSKPVFAKDSMFLQRINSITDGRKTTQFAAKYHDNYLITRTEKELAEKQGSGSDFKTTSVNLVSAGTILLTFSEAILPANFSFAVFDNESGQVLYHTQDKLSLVENFFVATNNNPHLLNARTIGSTEAIEFSGDYQGTPHKFWVGKLHENVPWSLVVMYTKHNLQLLNMMMMFTAIALCFLYLLLVSIVFYGLSLVSGLLPKLLIFSASNTSTIIKVTTLMLLWAIILALVVLLPLADQLRMILVVGLSLVFLIIIAWVRRKNKKIEVTSELRSTLFKPAYAAYCALLAIIITGIPSFYFTKSSLDFYLDKSAKLEQLNVNHQIQSKRDQRMQLLNTFGFSADEPTNNHTIKINTPKLESAYFCQPDKNVGASDSLWHLALVNKDAMQQKALCGDNLLRKTSEAGQPHSDGLIGWLFNKLPLNFELLSLIDDMEQTNPPAKTLMVKSNSDRLFVNAFHHNWSILIFMLIMAGALYFYLFKNLIVNRLLGLKLIDQLEIQHPTFKQESLTNYYDNYQHILLLRPTRASTDKLVEHAGSLVFGKVLDLRTEINLRLRTQEQQAAEKVEISINRTPLVVTEQQEDELQQTFNGLCNELVNRKITQKTLIIKNLGANGFDRDYRDFAFQFLELAMHQTELKIIILADVSPLFRLIHQQEYPNSEKIPRATQHELTQWSNLFMRFIKFYDWYPATVSDAEFPLSPFQVAKREATSWPELDKIEKEFIYYHCTETLTRHESAIKKYPDLLTLPQNFKLCFEHFSSNGKYASLSEQLKNSINYYWDYAQLDEFFNEKAGAIYRYRWEQCTRNERLLLYQIATDHVANPLNHEVIEHLVRRGYLVNRGLWQIGSRAFRHFVLSAENPEVMQEWVEETYVSTWRYLRIPIFVVIAMVIGFIAYTASEALETLLALMTGVLGIIPLLLRNLSLFKGGSSTTSSE